MEIFYREKAFHFAPSEIFSCYVPDPLWNILEKYTPGGVWIFKYTHFMCDFVIRFISEGVNILNRSAKWAYLLGIHTPPVQDVS